MSDSLTPLITLVGGVAMNVESPDHRPGDLHGKQGEFKYVETEDAHK